MVKAIKSNKVFLPFLPQPDLNKTTSLNTRGDANFIKWRPASVLGPIKS
jgi:hypothetical protein